LLDSQAAARFGSVMLKYFSGIVKRGVRAWLGVGS